MADRELNILIRARDFFSRTFKSLTDATRDVRKPTEDLTKSTEGLTRAEGRQKFAADEALRATQALGEGMARLGSGIDGAEKKTGGFVQFLKDRFVITLGDVVRGIRTVISGIVDLNKRAVEVQGVSIQFDSLAKSVGETADVMLGRLRSATQGTVSDFDLMKQANQAVLLQLNLTSQQMAKLAEGAVQLGKATGRTATEALGDLITGLGRQSKLILDNLGLLVDATAANETYAASIGKTAEALTDAERKTAFVAAGIRAIEERTANLSAIGASPFERIQASITNLKDAFASTTIQSKRLNESLDSLADTLGDPKTKAAVEDIATALVTAADAALRGAIKIYEFEKAWIKFDLALARGVANLFISEEAQRKQAQADYDLQASKHAAGLATQEFVDSLNAGIPVKKQDEEQTVSLEEAIRNLATAQDSAGTSSENLAKDIAAAAGSFGLSLERFAEAAERFAATDILQKRIDLLKKLGADEQEIIRAQNELIRASQQGTEALKALVAAGDEAGNAVAAGADRGKQGLDAVTNAADTAKQALENAGRDGGEAFARGVEEGARRAAAAAQAAAAAIGSPTFSPSGLQTGRVGISKGAPASFRDVGLIDLGPGGGGSAGGFFSVGGVQYVVLGNRTQALPASLFRGPGFSTQLINNLNLPVLR